MTKTIISILCFIGAIALFFFYTKPTYDGHEALRSQIAEYDRALDKAAELQRLKQSLLSRYNSFNPSDIDRLHKLLPDHVDNVRLVLDLDTLASRYGFALQNVVINAPLSGAAPIEEIGPDQTPYDSLTIRFTTTGRYQEFVQFLSELEKSLRIVDVTELKMDQTGATDSYRFDISLRTYWLK